MKISEIAKKLNVSTRTIRFYEQKGLIQPKKDEWNQYREFTEEDAWRLQTIISLREVGMPIDEVKKVLPQIDAGNKHAVRDYLELQRAYMYAQWVELKQNLETTEDMIAELNKDQELRWDDIFTLAEGSKRLRHIRNNWNDRWGFDHQAQTYDELTRGNNFEKVIGDDGKFYIHAHYEDALDLTFQLVWETEVEEQPAPEQTIRGLDIGIGTGNLASRFLRDGVLMCGIDQSKEMLKQCQAKYPTIDTKLGNFLAIPYLDGQFDFIVTSYALHHLTDEQKLLALEEMKRVLKPTGHLCITDLMFESEQKRSDYYDWLKQIGREEVIGYIEDEYYADRSVLLEWFEANGYVTKTKQMNDLLHIVYAKPMNK